MIDQCAILILDDTDTPTMNCINSCIKKYKNIRCYVINIDKNYLIQGDELSMLTLCSKLVIISHGCKQGCISSEYGYIHAFNMHRLLTLLGLKSVGLISFKGCYIGSGKYLEQLKAVFGNTINCYYMLAYKGKSFTVFNHECVGFLDVCIRMLSFTKLKLPDHHRVKILTGNMQPYLPLKNNKRWRYL